MVEQTFARVPDEMHPVIHAMHPACRSADGLTSLSTNRPSGSASSFCAGSRGWNGKPFGSIALKNGPAPPLQMRRAATTTSR
jgi:hypothetical protein